jgi:hypothetical protein
MVTAGGESDERDADRPARFSLIRAIRAANANCSGIFRRPRCDAGSRAAEAQLRGAHGSDRCTRTVEAGFFTNFAAGRIGRRVSSPPQFAHTKPSFSVAHARQ